MPSVKTPVLILVFNRPDKVRSLIAALEQVKPEQIYVSADGPRDTIPADIEKCREVRALFDNLPWKCEVHTNFSDKNLGCKQGPISGIDWFFKHVEQGIILEDDCIPNQSFFSFCSNLLEKYKGDAEIMHISGNNFQNGAVWGDGSYYFSLYTHSWGWATWRRAWEKFTPAIEDFADFDKNNTIATLPLSPAARRFWIKNFRHTLKGNDSWDSLWMYTVWYSNGLAVIPNKNLVSNIGFGVDATHTFTATKTSNLEAEEIETIVEPGERRLSTSADDYVFKQAYYRTILQRTSDKILSLLR